MLEEFGHDEITTVVPLERPRRCVSVQPFCCVHLAQDIETEDTENFYIRVFNNCFALPWGQEVTQSAGWGRRRKRTGIAQEGDECRGALLLHNRLVRWLKRISLNTERLKLMQGTKFWWNTGDVIVKEVKLLELREHAHLRWESLEAVSREVKKLEMS